MESLSAVIDKKMNKSLLKFMKLIDPQCQYRFTPELIAAWNRLEYVEQQKLYLYFLYRKWRNIAPYGTPLDIISYCHPAPFNWNQHPLGKSLIAERKAIIANYNGSYGTYTRDEAKLYQMTGKKWFSY